MFGLLQAGHQFVQRQLELGNLGLVLVDVLDNLFRALDRLLEVLFLPLAQLVRMLDRLLEARDFAAHLVVAALNLVEFFRPFALANPGLLERRLETALPGDSGLEPRLALLKPSPGVGRPRIEVTHAQRQQFGVVRRSSSL